MRARMRRNPLGDSIERSRMIADSEYSHQEMGTEERLVQLKRREISCVDLKLTALPSTFLRLRAHI